MNPFTHIETLESRAMFSATPIVTAEIRSLPMVAEGTLEYENTATVASSAGINSRQADALVQVQDPGFGEPPAVRAGYDLRGSRV